MIFVAFLEDNATMSSMPYFENRVSNFVQNRSRPHLTHFSTTNKCFDSNKIYN